jgi:hypothetical protein
MPDSCARTWRGIVPSASKSVADWSDLRKFIVLPPVESGGKARESLHIIDRMVYLWDSMSGWAKGFTISWLERKKIGEN